MAAAWCGLDGHCASEAEEASIDAVAGEFASTFGEATRARGEGWKAQKKKKNTCRERRERLISG